jgi:hypothetical protein
VTRGWRGPQSARFAHRKKKKKKAGQLAARTTLVLGDGLCSGLQYTAGTGVHTVIIPAY